MLSQKHSNLSIDERLETRNDGLETRDEKGGAIDERDGVSNPLERLEKINSF